VASNNLKLVYKSPRSLRYLRGFAFHAFSALKKLRLLHLSFKNKVYNPKD
jgi:hypothetical protein